MFHTRFTENSYTRDVQDDGIFIESIESFIFCIFCVLESKYIYAGSDLLFNMSLLVSVLVG